VSADAIRRARAWLEGSDRRQRRARAALQGRPDTTLAGAVLLDHLLDRLGARELVLCEWALREGLILHHLRDHPRLAARAAAFPDVRERSVAALAERCGVDLAHAHQVAALALALFEGTRRQHGLGAGERALLRHAAVLHDVGHHVSYPRHHHHSYYLIRNGDLRGFTALEVDVMANVARYHRRSQPRKRHASFRALPGRERRVVRVLAACLRLADALDRSHRQVVRRLDVIRERGTVRVACEVEGDAELELWGAARRRKLLESVMDCAVSVERVTDMAAAEARLA
jgi:exopolyphosphatase/guanosine-5'-triphosphate,3'-diphosphate pyrophosphatase